MDDEARRSCLIAARDATLALPIREALVRVVPSSLAGRDLPAALVPDVEALAATELAAAGFDMLFCHGAAEVRGRALPYLAHVSDAQATRLRVRAPHRWIPDLVALLHAAERPALDALVAELVTLLATQCMPMMGPGDEARSEAIVARVEAAIVRQLAEPTLDPARIASLADGLILAAPSNDATRGRLSQLAERARAQGIVDLLARVLIAWARNGIPLADTDTRAIVASPCALWLTYRWLCSLDVPVPAPLLDVNRRIEACAADWLALEEGSPPSAIVCVERRTHRLGDAPIDVGFCRATLGERVVLVCGEAGPDTHGLSGQLAEQDDPATRAEAWARLVAHHGLV